MNATREGGCQCGYIRYRLEGRPSGLSVCHCKDCQRQSGSAFGLSLAVAIDDFHLETGSLRSFNVLCDSGRTKQCAFCPECGTRIYHQTGSAMSIKAGTLDDTTALHPDAHYWTARKQSWFDLPEGSTCYVDDD